MLQQGEPQGHDAKWKKPVTKRHTLYDSTYMRCLKQSYSEMQKVERGPWGWGWRGSCSVGAVSVCPDEWFWDVLHRKLHSSTAHLKKVWGEIVFIHFFFNSPFAVKNKRFCSFSFPNNTYPPILAAGPGTFLDCSCNVLLLWTLTGAALHFAPIVLRIRWLSPGRPQALLRQASCLELFGVWVVGILTGQSAAT